MRLSLSILADWLSQYSPICSIATGDRTIRNVRMFSEKHRFADSNVYISRSSGDSGWVICMHKNDYILLQTEDENQVMNDIMDAFDYYNNWSDSLNRELPDLTLNDIMQRCEGIFDSAMMLTDASYYLLAHYRPQTFCDASLQVLFERGIMDLDQILNVEKDPRIREFRRKCYLQETGGFHLQASVRNLFTGGKHWGWLISSSPHHSRGQMDVQEELGDILEQWMQLHPEQQAQRELSGVFLSILEGSYNQRENVNYQLRLMGWNPDAEMWVYAIAAPEKALALVRKAEQLSDSVRALVYANDVIVLFCGQEVEQRRFHQHLIALLTQSDCRCGISPPFTDIFMLKEQYALAAAAAAATRSDRPLLPFEEIALDHAIGLLRDHCARWLVHPTLKQLRDYDSSNSTDFYETFHQYLCCECSIAATAQTMGLHRNTLLYRIARIRELTNLDIDNPKLRLHLRLSFEICASEN